MELGRSQFWGKPESVNNHATTKRRVSFDAQTALYYVPITETGRGDHGGKRGENGGGLWAGVGEADRKPLSR
jgi:hypothetical protein